MFFGAEVERQRSYKFRLFKAIFLALKLSPDLRHFFESFKRGECNTIPQMCEHIYFTDNQLPNYTKLAKQYTLDYLLQK